MPTKMIVRDLFWTADQIVIQAQGRICQSATELLQSPAFRGALENFLADLKERNSPVLKGVSNPNTPEQASSADFWLNLFGALLEKPLAQAVTAESDYLKQKTEELTTFVEHLYDFWRKFTRYLIWRNPQIRAQSSDVKKSAAIYQDFNAVAQQLNYIVRSAYRDVMHNITGRFFPVYRQIPAGAQMSVIAGPGDWPSKTNIYDGLKKIDVIRQVLMSPPMMMDPPMNKRTGKFVEIKENPLAGIDFDTSEWLCYPAQVGPLVIHIYFHINFMGLACSCCNLFELATEEQLRSKPDAIYAYGVPGDVLYKHAKIPNLVYHDEENDVWVGAIPGNKEFGYFGYVKKMTLTLHNIVMMKKYGRQPYHGAMVRIAFKSGIVSNVVIMGDSGTGKSESIEAFRAIAGDEISELTVIADDMGSFEVRPDGKLVGYGTEIGAFVRLDDLQPGYAFQQLDRAIIMSPQKVNARCVIPVTSLKEVLRGYEVDFLLYANNFEEVDDEHAVIDQFKTAEEAITVFSSGLAMSKGTTTSTGLTREYWANIFGPPLFRELHDELAKKHFAAAFKQGTYVGQLRTRLGISGYESKGPQASAKRLFELIQERSKK
jgi:hypothetical protein